MTYVVTQACINCKYSDCVPVCPVDCFYEGENMLVINPEECIDCGVCVDECPVKAIVPESSELIDWVALNAKYAKLWPQITHLLEPLPQAEAFKDIDNKLSLLSEKPGNGYPERAI